MTFINYASREINCKIVYYGPGLCGKTTNLQFIYDKTNPGNKGKLISLATETDRTLFFDFLPLELCLSQLGRSGACWRGPSARECRLVQPAYRLTQGVDHRGEQPIPLHIATYVHDRRAT